MQDINEPLNKPEVFAAQLVADLQLPQEMEPAIALAITEQITNYRQLRSGPAGASILIPNIAPLPETVSGDSRSQVHIDYYLQAVDSHVQYCCYCGQSQQ
jgi:SNF5 / SMARCB1 / INI1